MNTKAIEFSGHWSGDDPFPIAEQPQPREVTYYKGFIRSCRVEWWTERVKFKARVEWKKSVEKDGMTTVTGDFERVSDVRVERSELWRRIGFYVLRFFGIGANDDR